VAVLVLVAGPLLLAVFLARCLRWTRLRWTCGRLAPGPAHRAAVLASLGLTAVARLWLAPPRIGWLPGFSLTLAGAFLGGVTTTGAATGLVENNAPPSPGVREKVLAYHDPHALPYPPVPRFKRAMDIGVAALGLVLTLPAWFLIAGVIWFEDPGPIFFTKNSVGLGGVTFRQLKFRSMKVDAERTTGPVASSADDPRKLRCGKWLRRWHLDELPELVNVLAGTMSLVGPRPLRTVLVHGYLETLPDFAERHSVKPGIACIAQIKGYHLPPAERLGMDRDYIRQMGIGLDLRLLCRAVLTTLRGARKDS
jgi:lipopolysaccharide/colanic/teichoic acid biosynthesis glycosyltransferase